MKEFVVYTLMRLLVFAACLLLVWTVWAALDNGQVNGIWSLFLAFVLSGVVSYFLLNRQREAFARRVEVRAGRASRRFEERRAREDVDDADD